MSLKLKKVFSKCSNNWVAKLLMSHTFFVTPRWIAKKFLSANLPGIVQAVEFHRNDCLSTQFVLSL